VPIEHGLRAKSEKAQRDIRAGSNEASSNIPGFTREVLAGIDSCLITHPEDRDRYAGFTRQRLAGEINEHARDALAGRARLTAWDVDVGMDGYIAGVRGTSGQSGQMNRA